MLKLQEYIDYRKFLKDYYDYEKTRNKNFSYRYFAKKAEIQSSGLLMLVIDGKRNLTSIAVEKFAKAMKLSPKDAEYFTHLVKFNQGKTATEKQLHYQSLIRLNKPLKELVLNTNQYEYYSKWYLAVLRELLCLYNFEEDYQRIANAVYPSITAKEAKDAIEILVKLGLISKHGKGKYTQTNTAIVAEKDIVLMALQKYMESMLDNAKKAIFSSSHSQRNISGMTIGVSQTDYELIVEELKSFKSRVKIIVNQGKNADQVYQLNLELFPVSAKMPNASDNK